MLPTAKIPHIMNHTVKALKSIPSAPAPSKLQYLEAKTTLGETFGTKKQKANIRAQERNRIDVSAMEGVMDYVMDSIDKGAGGLMTEGASTMFNRKHTPLKPLLHRTQSKQKMRLTRTGLSHPSLSLRPIPQKFIRCITLYRNQNGKLSSLVHSTLPRPIERK